MKNLVELVFSIAARVERALGLRRIARLTASQAESSPCGCTGCACGTDRARREA